MKKYIFSILAATALVFTACDDILNRPQLNTPVDNAFWRNETDARLFANGFYINYFVGYNSGWGTSYAPLRGYNFSDDVAYTGKQSAFENSIPESRGSSKEEMTFMTQYAGPSWNFAWVRKANTFMNRLETEMKGKLSEEAYNHWYAVAQFFKCYSYSRLVSVFGDVPYYEKAFSNTEKDIMFKDRDSRVTVMNAVHDMLDDVLTNMRTDDGANVLNRYVAAAFASRWMLFEGTWQKYHGGDQEAAKKYLKLAVKAGDVVINSGNYAIDTPFREVFGSQDLKGNREAIMYRHYDAAVSVTHHVASYSNGYEGQSPAPNLALAKSFICQDGKVYQKSNIDETKVLSIANMIKTRDPRFEATFMDFAKKESSTLLYASKFIDREGPALEHPEDTPTYGSMTNTNDAPVIRYAEVLLNWIEAKAELALLGEPAVTQDDIDKSINQLRRRPLDNVAIAKGMKNTVDMKLVDITADFDPARDADVNPLIWEVRRERRMELIYEHSRLLDIKRWKKLNYMNTVEYRDIKLGPWVDMPKEIDFYLTEDAIGKRQVMKEDGTIIVWNGSNKADMVGYYMPDNVQDRDPFSDRSYCAPIGEQEIRNYKDFGGYTLTQTSGW